MATLTPTLTLVSTDALTDSLNISVTDSLSVLGQSKRFTVIIDSSEDELFADAGPVLAAADNTKSYVFFQNKSSTSAEVITLGLADNDSSGDDALETTNITLGAGEFAFYPWDSSTDIIADAASGTPVLEVMVFQAAA